MERIKTLWMKLGSLRYRVSLLVLISVLPTLILLVVSNAMQVDHRQEQIRDSALRMAHLLAASPATVEASQLSALASQMGLPDHITVEVIAIDRRGNILDQYPSLTAAVGQSLTDNNLFQRIQRSKSGGTFESRCMSSTQDCLYAFSPLEPAGDSRFLLIEIPTQVAFAEANQLLLYQLFGLTLVTLLALMAAWVGSERFLLRDIRILCATTQQIAAGDRTVRTGIATGASELSYLAHEFDRMADALEQDERELQSAAKAQSTSEARLANILQNASEAILSIDHEGKILVFNKVAEDIFGYSSQEVLGQPLKMLLPEDQEPPSIDLAEGDTQPRRTLSWKRKSDQVFFASMSTSWIVENEQTITTFFLWDVTERMQTDRELQENRRTLSMLLSNLPGMAYRQRKREKWTMEFISEGALPLTGYSPTALIDETPLSYRQLIPLEDRERIAREMEQAVQKGCPYHVTYPIRHASGQEKWVWEQGQPTPFGDDQQPVVEGFITDITERKEAEQKVEDQFKRLASLRAIDLAIIGLLDLNPILATLVEQVISQLRLDAAAILLYNEPTHNFEYAYGQGFRSRAALHLRARLGDGFIGRAALQRKPVLCKDIRQRPDDDNMVDIPAIAGEEFVALGAISLVAKSEIKGVLVVFHRSPLEIDPDWLGFLEALADQAAIAIENTTLYEKSRRANFELSLAYEETIEGWAQALEMRDQETEGHSRRVMELTVALAREIGIPDDEIVHFRRGALLHDIGKMGIPDHILLKPGKLTEDEMAIMREHPAHAYKMLASIPFLVPAMDIPFSHHERWDGTGYPRGLKGRAIPLAARVFAVIDVWDALRSERPYREALSKEEVRRYILDQSGKEFDPQVVEKFISLEGKKPWLFR